MRVKFTGDELRTVIRCCEELRPLTTRRKKDLESAVAEAFGRPGATGGYRLDVLLIFVHKVVSGLEFTGEFTQQPTDKS